MSLAKKVKRCSHCGSILQDKNPNEEGFIDSIILKKYPDGVLLCNKCFNEIQNSDNSSLVLSEDFKKVLAKIKKEKGLILYIIDLFSFEGCFPSEFNNEIGDTDVIVLGTKRDLLPKNVDDELLKKYVTHRLNVSNVKVKEVILTSSINEANNNKIFNYFLTNLKDKNIYILGPKTSGKSTLLREFLKVYKNDTKLPISSYNFEGTNLSGLRVPLTNKSAIYELPSLSIQNSMLGILEKPIVNYIVPGKEVAPKKVVISDKSSLIVSGLCLIQQFSEGKTPLKCYFSEKLDVKVKRGDGLKAFKNILKNGTQKNTSYKYRDIKDFDAYDFEISETGSRDIGILGLGWISFEGNKQKFRIFVPKGIYVYSTRSKVNLNVK